MAENFRDQINTARRAGYSDDELIGYLKDKDPRVTQALDSGYKPGEIFDRSYLEMIAFFYALLPCLIKLLTIFLLTFFTKKFLFHENN